VDWAVWLPIIIAAAVAVGGAVKWYRGGQAAERRRTEDRQHAADEAERQKWDDHYTNVLEPLRQRFEVSGSLSRELLLEPYFIDLEYHPSQLAALYAGLPAGDYRRDGWRQLIDNLQASNEKALELIHKGVGQFSPEMKDVAVDFEKHALQWRAVWEAKENPPRPPPEGENETERRAAPFPETMIETLKQELAKVEARRHAG
jgi:hypothetical protein